jgi:hypothetical protein
VQDASSFKPSLEGELNEDTIDFEAGSRNSYCRDDQHFG